MSHKEIVKGGIHFTLFADPGSEQEADLERKLNALPVETFSGTGHAGAKLSSEGGRSCVELGTYPREGYVVKKITFPNGGDTNAGVNLSNDSATFNYQGTRYHFVALTKN